MGKVRRLRQKYHLSLKSSTQTNTSCTPSTLLPLPVVLSVPGKAPAPIKLKNDSDIFKGVNISFSDLNHTLLPPPTLLQNVLGAESSKEEVNGNPLQSKLSKKEKRLARRAELLRKMDTVQSLKAEAKQKLQKKKKRVKFMDVEQLTNAVPELPVIDRHDTVKQISLGKEMPNLKKKKSLLGAKQRKLFLEDIKQFKAVLSNDTFKADPLTAISNYVVNSIAKNNEHK